MSRVLANPCRALMDVLPPRLNTGLARVCLAGGGHCEHPQPVSSEWGERPYAIDRVTRVTFRSASGYRYLTSFKLHTPHNPMLP